MSLLDLKKLYVENYTPGLLEGNTSVSEISKYHQKIHKLWRRIDGDPDLARYLLGGKVLDFGCNCGKTLPILAAIGAQPYGLEFNPVAAEKACRYGFEVFVGNLAEAPWPDSFFDTVLLSQVIEHLPEPVEVLSTIRKKLRKRGRLLIACPNVRSFYRHIFRMHWAHWHLPFHLHHFTALSLRRIVEQAGFEVLQLFTVTPGYWVIMSWRVWRHTSFGVRNQFLSKPMQVWKRLGLAPLNRLIDMTGCGDCLVMIAEKTNE